jgi:hypothetical protein
VVFSGDFSGFVAALFGGHPELLGFSANEKGAAGCCACNAYDYFWTTKSSTIESYQQGKWDRQGKS